MSTDATPTVQSTDAALTALLGNASQGAKTKTNRESSAAAMERVPDSWVERFALVLPMLTVDTLYPIEALLADQEGLPQVRPTWNEHHAAIHARQPVGIVSARLRSVFCPAEGGTRAGLPDGACWINGTDADADKGEPARIGARSMIPAKAKVVSEGRYTTDGKPVAA